MRTPFRVLACGLGLSHEENSKENVGQKKKKGRKVTPGLSTYYILLYISPHTEMQPASRYIFVISRFIYPEPSPDQIGSDMKRSMNIRVAISHANGPFLLKSIPQESVTF